MEANIGSIRNLTVGSSSVFFTHVMKIVVVVPLVPHLDEVEKEKKEGGTFFATRDEKLLCILLHSADSSFSLPLNSHEFCTRSFSP